ncbi:MAG: hypothetical protein ACR2N5_02500 [Solirubrobacterales bacterium]
MTVLLAAMLVVGTLTIFEAAPAPAQDDPAFDQYRLDIPLDSAATDSGGDTAASEPPASGQDAADDPSAASAFGSALTTPLGIAVALALAALGVVVVLARRRTTGMPGGTTAFTLAIVVAALGLVACGGEDGADDADAAGFFGVQPRSNPEADDFARMAEAGVETYRVFISWVDVQRSEGAGYDWSRTDPVMIRLAFNDIEPLVYFAGVPTWLSEDRRDSPVATERSRDAVGRFMAAAAERYGPGSDFWRDLESSDLMLEPEPVRVWQIWNEQNSAFAWRPKASVREYATLLRIGAGAIRAVDPDARIMTGGMFGTPPAEGSIRAWRYARGLLSDPEVRDLVDVVGIHPYSPTIDGVRFQVEAMREAMEESGAADLPIWVTEIGWGSSDRGGLMVGLDGQARMLTEAFELFERNRDSWKLEGVVWFSWRDDRTLPGRNVFDGSSGLLTDGGERKPAFDSYAALAGGS